MYPYHLLQQLINIDSPSGFTEKACDYIVAQLTNMGYTPQRTNKGSIRCQLGKNPTLAITAHVDTLGAMVSGIHPDGTLALSRVGGLQLNGFEGSYCRIYTLDDAVYHGTLLLNNPAAHVNNQVNTIERTSQNMHIRLDEMVTSGEQVIALGIQTGDFICFEPGYTELESGYIKSRFMDNKAGCFVLLELARHFKNQPIPVELHFSHYEEVGHGGASGYSPSIEELLVIDMGVVGDRCSGKETHCSICAKDSTGTYDYAFRKKLVALAKQYNIPYVQDIYPYYGSDGSAALRAGHDFRVALIGPGVSASHGMERTHKKGIEATISLCIAYVNSLK
jgi:putative aminopeptidase FrvX